MGELESARQYRLKEYLGNLLLNPKAKLVSVNVENEINDVGEEADDSGKSFVVRGYGNVRTVTVILDTSDE